MSLTRLLTYTNQRGQQAEPGLEEVMKRADELRRNGVEVHRVRVTGKVPRQGRPIYWAFGLADYAELFGLKPEGLKSMLRRGEFDPKSLKSLCECWARRHPASEQSSTIDPVADVHEPKGS